MSPKHPVCRDLEPDLVAAAIGEAGAAATERVRTHVDRCTDCRDEYTRYRQIEGVCDTLRREPPREDEARARRTLISRLSDLKRKIVHYRIVPSPLGHLLLARSEDGIAIVEYLGAGKTLAASRLAKVSDVEAIADDGELERYERELIDFLGGRRTRLDWPLDLRLARGEFDRTVLTAATRIPYGAVTSYARIAAEIGKPSASRAVAQALRWNPVPVVVPCHRVIGSSGALTGYAGDKLGLKRQILAVEGVPTVAAREIVQRDAMYVRYKNDPAYCVPTCGDISKRSLAELTLFGTREHVEALGLRPCSDCRPDLHPLAHA